MSELRVALTIMALLAAMVLCGVLGARHRSGSLALALLSFVWLTIDHFFEGQVLLAVTPTHGLTTSDLVGVAGFLVAVAEFFVVTSRR